MPGAGCRGAEAGEERRARSPGPSAVGRRAGRGSWRCLRAKSAERNLSGLSHLVTWIEPGAPKKRSGSGHCVAVLALPMGCRGVGQCALGDYVLSSIRMSRHRLNQSGRRCK